MIDNNLRTGGLFHLTDALEKVRENKHLEGLIICGERHNIGSPNGYIMALEAFSGRNSNEKATPEVKQSNFVQLGAAAAIGLAASVAMMFACRFFFKKFRDMTVSKIATVIHKSI